MHYILVDKVRLWAAASGGCVNLPSCTPHRQEGEGAPATGGGLDAGALACGGVHGEAEWEGGGAHEQKGAGCCYVRFTDIQDEDQVLFSFRMWGRSASIVVSLITCTQWNTVLSHCLLSAS